MCTSKEQNNHELLLLLLLPPSNASYSFPSSAGTENFHVIDYKNPLQKTENVETSAMKTPKSEETERASNLGQSSQNGITCCPKRDSSLTGTDEVMNMYHTGTVQYVPGTSSASHMYTCSCH